MSNEDRVASKSSLVRFKQEATEETEFSLKPRSLLSPLKKADFRTLTLDSRHSSLFMNVYLLEITCANPAMETDGVSNLPSVRLANGGEGVNLNGSDPPGAISPAMVG